MRRAEDSARPGTQVLSRSEVSAPKGMIRFDYSFPPRRIGGATGHSAAQYCKAIETHDESRASVTGTSAASRPGGQCEML